MMWTLVLFTMIVNTGAGGGANTTVTTLEFASEGTCLAAAKTLAEEGAFKDQSPTAYRIFGKCIQRASVRGRF